MLSKKKKKKWSFLNDLQSIHTGMYAINRIPVLLNSTPNMRCTQTMQTVMNETVAHQNQWGKNALKTHTKH